MSRLATQFSVYVGPPGAPVDKNPAPTFDEAIDKLAERIKEEAANLRKAGFVAMPATIRVARDAALDEEWLSVTIEAAS